MPIARRYLHRHAHCSTGEVTEVVLDTRGPATLASIIGDQRACWMLLRAAFDAGGRYCAGKGHPVVEVTDRTAFDNLTRAERQWLGPLPGERT